MSESFALELVDLIYRSAQDASVWRVFLETLSRATGESSLAMSLSLPDLALPQYQFRAHQRADLCFALTRQMQRGLIWGSLDAPVYQQRFVRQSVEREALLANDIYRDWMQPQGMAPEGPISHVIAAHDGRPTAALSLFRREGCRPFADEDVELCDQLVPHLGQAYAIHEALEEARSQQRALFGVMDRVPVGIFLLDAARRVVLTNRSALLMLEKDDGLSLVDGCIEAADPVENARLHGAVDQCAQAARTQSTAGAVLAVSRPSGGRAFAVSVYPLAEAERGWSAADAIVSLLVTDPEGVAVSGGDVLQRLYSLTPAEAELIRLIVDGASIDQTARRRGVAVSTVRSQIKTIYSKTGARRRSELVHLVLGGVGVLRND